MYTSLATDCPLSLAIYQRYRGFELGITDNENPSSGQGGS